MSFRRHIFICVTGLWLLPLSGQDYPNQRAADAAFGQAVKIEGAGNHVQALSVYRELFSQFPANARYYQRLKRLLRITGELDEALAVINQYLQVRPDDLNSRIEVGDIYLLKGEYDEAMAIWMTVLQTFPGNTMAERLVLTKLMGRQYFERGQAVLKQLRNDKGEPAFFALELGHSFSARMAYDLAADEYIRYLRANPRAAAIVTTYLLRFPKETETGEMLRAKLNAIGSSQSRQVLSNVEFAYGNFDDAVRVFTLTSAPPKDAFDLGVNLAAEGEYDLAEVMFQKILTNRAAASIHERAVMALANVYQQRSQSNSIKLPMSDITRGNRFFATPFIQVDDAHIAQLGRSIALYDSLVQNWRNPRARLRLGEIKYRILDDFDGAISDLEAIVNDRNAASLHPEALLRLVNVWIAKGDLDGAEFALVMARRQIKNEEYYTQMEVKATELIFLSGNRDSLQASLDIQMATVGPTDLFFNDLLELSMIVQIFEEHDPEFQAFVFSEQLIRQNRRSEAIVVLTEILNRDPSAVTPFLQYRLALLHAWQKNYFDAEKYALSIEEGTVYAELGHLLSAEIADHIMAEINVASTRYLEFLDLFTGSIYTDAVRLRYRTLTGGIEQK